MCTVYSEEQTDKFSQSEITCYKVLELIDNQLISPIFNDFGWHIGWNKAVGKRSYCRNGDHVTQGIHVIFDEKEAIKFASTLHPYDGGCYVVVPVKCYKEDLIGCGTNSYDDGVYDKVAVFEKVFLAKEDYEKAAA